MTFAPPSPHLTPEAVALVKHFEGRRLDAYTDAVGVPTIGYGHTGGVRQGASITPDQADELLRYDLNAAQADVLHAVKVPLNENEYAALVSLAFNIGGPAFSRSRCVKLLNDGDRARAADEFGRFVKGHVNGRAVTLKGLELRRQAERDLFLCKPGEAAKDGYMFLAGQTIPLPPSQLPDPPVRSATIAQAPKAKTTNGRHIAVAAGIGGGVGTMPLINQFTDTWKNAGGPSLRPLIDSMEASWRSWLMQLPHAGDVRDAILTAASYLQHHQLLALLLGIIAIYLARKAIMTMRAI